MTFRAVLALIPRELLLVLLLVSVGFGLWTGQKLVYTQLAASKAQVAHAQERAQAAEVAASTLASQREAKQREDAQRQANQEKQDAQIEAERTAAAKSAASADRLQRALSIAANTLRHSGAGTDPTAVQARETAARATELFGTCSAEYRFMASAAASAVIAGQRCEADYEAVRLRNKQ